METLGYLCLGYAVIGIGLGVLGHLLLPLIEYESENRALCWLGDAAEDVMGHLTAGYMLALPIIMVIGCYITGQALGEMTGSAT